MPENITINTVTADGAGIHPVTLTISLQTGLPLLLFVGIPNQRARETRIKLAAIMKNCGFRMPNRKIIVDVSPATTVRSTQLWDLPLLIGILLADYQLHLPNESGDVSSLSAFGQVSLRGELCENTVDTAAIAYYQLELLDSSPDSCCGKTLLIPQTSFYRMRPLIRNCPNFFPLRSIKDLNAENKGRTKGITTNCLTYVKKENSLYEREIKIYPNQNFAWLAICAAVLGRHHLLITGAPGTGKSSLLNYAAALMPKLPYSTSLRQLELLAVSPDMPKANLLNTFDVAHCEHPGVQAKIKDFIGDVAHDWPGLIRLTNNGILFMDEFNHFSPGIIKVIKHFLTEKELETYQAGKIYRIESEFLCLAAMNPCPCGQYLSEGGCNCSAAALSAYWRYIDEALLDRFDCTVVLPKFDANLLEEDTGCQKIDLNELRDKFETASQRQKLRLEKHNLGFVYNARADLEIINKCFNISAAATEQIFEISRKYNSSSRSQHSLLTLSRTVADLADSEKVTPLHVATAWQMKQKFNWGGKDAASVGVSAMAL